MTCGKIIGNTSNANSQQIMSVIFRKENLTFCSNFAPLDPGRRPKTCKLGKRWTGPFVILNRMGVNYKIQSSSGRTFVAHHDQLKLHYAPTGPRNIFCPAREHGDFTVVDNDPVAPVVHPISPLVPPPAPPVPRLGLQDCAPMSALQLGAKMIFCKFARLT